MSKGSEVSAPSKHSGMAKESGTANGSSIPEKEKMDTVAILPNAREKWYHKITVEPPMFLYMMAYMTTSVVEQAFFVYRACRVDHGYSEEICRNISDKSYEDIKKEVQVTVSNFHQWNSVLGHIVPIFLAFYMGAWSDKRGRKIPLLMGLVGKLIYSCMIVVNTYQTNWPLNYVIYTATIPSALTGADVAIFASAFAYISDVTSVKDRTIRVTILDGTYLSTMPAGLALGSWLFSKVVDGSYSIMFIINASCLVLAVLYTAIHLKWQTKPHQRSIAEVGCCGILPDFFDHRNLLGSLHTLARKRTMRRRTYLWLFMIIMALYTFQRDEKPMMFLYTQLKFNWDTVVYSYYRTYQSLAYVVMMLAGIPVMSRVFGLSDTVIVMIGAMAHASARFFFIFALEGWVLYLGATVSSLGPIVAPVLRSMTSKIVPVSERGKVFALLSVCDNAVPLFSGVLYSQVYNHTINTQPAAIFWLTMATQLAVFAFMLFIHVTLRGRSLAVDEIEAATAIAAPTADRSDDSGDRENILKAPAEEEEEENAEPKGASQVK